jgi:hypothetical protein
VRLKAVRAAIMKNPSLVECYADSTDNQLDIVNDCNAFKTSIIIYQIILHIPQALESLDIPSSSFSQLQIS